MILLICSTGYWDVNDLRFYSKSDCTGTNYNDGIIISSGYHTSYPPEYAFDANMITTWGGKGEGTPAIFWIGMEFVGSIDVQCVSFLDLSTDGVTGVEVQVLTANVSDWVSIIRVEDLVPGVRHNITVAEFSSSPVNPPSSSTPMNSPSSAPTILASSIPTKAMSSSPVSSPPSNIYYESWRIWATTDMTRS